MFNGTLVGVVTSEVKLKSDKSGKHVCNFDVAENRKVKGMSQTVTEFITVAAFGTTADACAKYLQKGRRVAVKVSHIQAKAYTGKDGQPRAKINVYADEVEFGDRVEITFVGDEFVDVPREQTPYLESVPDMPDGFVAVDSAELPF